MPFQDFGERAVFEERDRAGSERRDVVVEPLHREAVQIDEIARHVHRDELAIALTVIEIAAHEAFEQQAAHGDEIAPPRQLLAGGQRLHAGHRLLDHEAFFLA